MGVCPTYWMLLVGVLRITGTLIYTARGTARKSGCTSCCVNLLLSYALSANAAAEGSGGFVRMFNLWSTSLSSRSMNS